MTTINEIFSIYIVIAMLGIGFYMAFLQSNFLKTVDNLPRESAFTKAIGYLYIVIGVISFIIYLQ